MITKTDIVSMAREYKGVPYRHQGRSTETGVDCAGLLALIAGRIGLEYPENFTKGKKLKGKGKEPKGLFKAPKSKNSKYGRSIKNLRYTRNPETFELQSTLDLVLNPISLQEVQPGDVLLLKIDIVPQHVAIVGGYKHGGLSMVHAYSRIESRTGKQIGKVVEHRFAKIWLPRVIQAYQIPGVEAV